MSLVDTGSDLYDPFTVAASGETSNLSAVYILFPSEVLSFGR